jgi:hypothetical protein
MLARGNPRVCGGNNNSNNDNANNHNSNDGANDGSNINTTRAARTFGNNVGAADGITACVYDHRASTSTCEVTLQWLLTATVLLEPIVVENPIDAVTDVNIYMRDECFAIAGCGTLATLFMSPMGSTIIIPARAPGGRRKGTLALSSQTMGVTKSSAASPTLRTATATRNATPTFTKLVAPKTGSRQISTGL